MCFVHVTDNIFHELHLCNLQAQGVPTQACGVHQETKAGETQEGVWSGRH